MKLFALAAPLRLAATAAASPLRLQNGAQIPVEPLDGVLPQNPQRNTDARSQHRLALSP